MTELNTSKTSFIERDGDRRDPNNQTNLTYVERRLKQRRVNPIDSFDSLMTISNFLESRGVKDPDNQDIMVVMKEALTKNLLGLETRERLSAFFDGGFSIENLTLEEGDENKIQMLILDAKGLGLMPRAEGDSVLKILSELFSKVLGEAINSSILVGLGGDEIGVLTKDVLDFVAIKDYLSEIDKDGYITVTGKKASFSITEVLPRGERENTVLSAALYLQCPLEIEEVRAIAGDQTRYEELLVKALVWRQFREYVKSGKENQKTVLEAMAKTNAVIGLTMDLILELGCEETVILNCISPMLFSSSLSPDSSIDELVAQICKTNVIKSGPLAELALNLGGYVLFADPKPKVANMLGLSYGDQVLANTFAQLQGRFSDEELKYIVPVTISPIECMVLINPECAKCVKGFQRGEYLTFAKRFKEICNQDHSAPINLVTPIEMSVTIIGTRIQELRNQGLMDITGIIPGLLDYIKIQSDKAWCIDLINLLNTPQNQSMLKQLVKELQNRGKQTTKEVCTQYVQGFAESGNIQDLSFAKAIMMINRTEGYINKVLDYFDQYNPSSDLIMPLNELLGILVTEKSQQP